MKTLMFYDRLNTHRFRFGNNYTFEDLIKMNLWFPKEAEEFPFLVMGGNLRDEHIQFSNADGQFQGRQLNTRRIIEILDGPQYPIRVKIGTMEFIAGKGFLARYNNKHDLDLLYVASITKKQFIDRRADLKEVKFYISKDIYKEEYKSRILVIMKEIMTSHTGDLVITNNIRNYLGGNIVIPPMPSLLVKKAFTNQVVEHCFTVLANEQGGMKEEIKPMIPPSTVDYEEELPDLPRPSRRYRL